MTAPSPSPGRPRPPAGLLGLLGLVVAVELVLARHGLDFVRPFTYDWVVSGRAARAKATGCDLLCFGDSLVKFGVAPGVLERRLGRRTYNLAVCGGQAPSSYFLLRRALESGARPAALLVDFMPHLLAHGPRHNLRQWPEFVDLREFVDLNATTRNAGMLASLGLGRLLTSVRARFEIRSGALAILRGEEAPSRAKLARFVRNWEVNRGAQLNPPSGSPPGEVDLARREDFPRAWACHPANSAYLRRFLALAEAHDIAVYWLLPPVRPDVQARRDRLGVDGRYARFLREMQARFPNLVAIDGRRSGYGPEVFEDPVHLDRRGAAALSGGLATVLRRAPAGRWVELPAYRDPPPGVALEDIDQSALALGVPVARRTK